MKYLFINSVVGYGSTGKIVYKLCKDLTAEGNQCVAAWGRACINSDDIDTYKIGNKFDLAARLDSKPCESSNRVFTKCTARSNLLPIL